MLCFCDIDFFALQFGFIFNSWIVSWWSRIRKLEDLVEHVCYSLVGNSCFDQSLATSSPFRHKSFKNANASQKNVNCDNLYYTGISYKMKWHMGRMSIKGSNRGESFCWRAVIAKVVPTSNPTSSLAQHLTITAYNLQDGIGSRQKKPGYFTVRLTVSVYPLPLRSAFFEKKFGVFFILEYDSICS